MKATPPFEGQSNQLVRWLFWTKPPNLLDSGTRCFGPTTTGSTAWADQLLAVRIRPFAQAVTILAIIVRWIMGGFGFAPFAY